MMDFISVHYASMWYWIFIALTMNHGFLKINIAIIAVTKIIPLQIQRFPSILEYAS